MSYEKALLKLMVFFSKTNKYTYFTRVQCSLENTNTLQRGYMPEKRNVGRTHLGNENLRPRCYRQDCHSRRLKKERVQTRQRRNHFRHRTVNRWNSLTEEVVSAPSLNSFKSRLDELWRGYSYIQNDCFPVRTHRREDQLTGF